MKNSLNGLILTIYHVAFLLLIYGSWSYLWKAAGNPPLAEETFVFFMVISISILLTTVTLVIKKISMNENIVLDFWTFLPIIFYGLIYSYFAMGLN